MVVRLCPDVWGRVRSHSVSLTPIHIKLNFQT